jgi:hypothetical protein
MREIGHQLELIRIKLARFYIDQAQRAKRMAVVRPQWESSVKANPPDPCARTDFEQSAGRE